MRMSGNQSRNIFYGNGAEVMKLEDFINRENIIELSFFNFRNAITAAYFADEELNIECVNENFAKFFPLLGDIGGLYFPKVLKSIGVEDAVIDNFVTELKQKGRVLIPEILITTDDGEAQVFSLLSAHTQDPNFSYLNGIQGQFVDRTAEYNLRKEREKLLEEKIRDREIIEEKSRQLESLANRLAKYLSPQVYNTLFTGDRDVTERFSRKNLTIFFSDIERFTDITDDLEPERLAFIINSYLSAMSSIALENGGTIDKFIGDAIVIFFGDPETRGDQEDAAACVRMALAMQEKMYDLNKMWRSKGLTKPMHVRMGINTGYCTVGNFGSEQKLDYTVLGSPVNMAARLQALAKPDRIVISEATYLLLQELVEAEKLEQVTLKGFKRPINTFELKSFIDSSAAEPKQNSFIHSGKYVDIRAKDKADIEQILAELSEVHATLQEKISTE
jgi:class 3 adenylate cyclase